MLPEIVQQLRSKNEHLKNNKSGEGRGGLVEHVLVSWFRSGFGGALLVVSLVENHHDDFSTNIPSLPIVVAVHLNKSCMLTNRTGN